MSSTGTKLCMVTTNYLNYLNNNDNKSELELLEEEVNGKYDGNYIDYAMDKSKYLLLNEESNIANDILLAFMIVRGAKGCFNLRHGKSDSGKSFSMETPLKYYIPKEHIINRSSQTDASFINECKNNKRAYDRKILYFGDLGDRNHYEKMRFVFNIIKILVSEGYYNHKKMGNDNETIEHIELEGVTGAFYQTVLEDDDKTKQNESRSFISSPALNSKTEKVKFSNRIRQKPYEEYFKRNETIEELESFKLHFNECVKKFDFNTTNYIVINPFIEYSFLELTELSPTETRQHDIIVNMFESYCYLNYKRRFTVKSKENLYLIPKIEDVQKFINLISSNVGLKIYEKELLLFLDKHLSSLDNLTAEDTYNEIKDKIYNKNPSINPNTLKSMAMDKLMSIYGIPKTKKEAEKLGNNECKYFFIASTIDRRFNSKEVKNIDKVGNCLSDLSIRGFIGKLEEKKGKANVYYIDKDMIKNLKNSYIINNKDINGALNHIIEINQLKKTKLISRENLLLIEDNYRKTNLTKIKYYS